MSGIEYALVGSNGQYVMDFADKAFGETGYRWTADPNMSRKFSDWQSAQEEANASNSDPRNMPVRVVALPQSVFYGIAQVDSNGVPVKYLPFKVGWMPHMSYVPTTNVSKAWRLADGRTAQETAEVMNATSGNNPQVQVIELDGNGPPLI